MALINKTLKKPIPAILFIVVIVLMAMAPQHAKAYTVISLITILMYVNLTLSWTIFSGPTNYISLATGAFFGVGVYITAVFGKEIPLYGLAAIAGIVSLLLATLIGVLTLRLKGVYFILFTFGVSTLIRHSIAWWEAEVTSTVGRFVRGPGNDTVYYYLLAITVAIFVIAYGIRETKFGMALRGIGENEEAAAHIGINVTLYKIAGFAVSAIFMGVTGAVMANRWSYIDPTIAFNPLISFLPVLMAIFGGTSRLMGPILGAAIFTLLQEYLITSYPYYYMLLMGVTLIVVILFLPEGLLGLMDRLLKRLPRIKFFKEFLSRFRRA